jgi:hypothetical protein
MHFVPVTQCRMRWDHNPLPISASHPGLAGGNISKTTKNLRRVDYQKGVGTWYVPNTNLEFSSSTIRMVVTPSQSTRPY